MGVLDFFRSVKNAAFKNHIDKHIEEEYKEAENKVEKFITLKGNPEQMEIKNFLSARSCYKQWNRMFNTKTVDNKTVTIEARELIEIIKKANFDVGKLENNISKGIKTAYDFLKPMYTKEYLITKNSVLRIYFDAIEVLQDRKLLSYIQKWNNELLSITKGGLLSKNQTDMNMQNVYRKSFLINAYANILMLVIHLTAQFSTISLINAGKGYGEHVSKSASRAEEFVFQYNKTYAYFLQYVACQHIPMIIYFKHQRIDELEKNMKIDLSLNGDRSKEDLERDKRIYGVESLSIAIIVGLGIALGLITIVPAIRAMIYYWGSLKIKLSQYYKEESIYLAFNVERLKEQLNNTTDPDEREKLEKIIEKQLEFVEDLKQKSIKWSIGYEETITTVNTVAESDQESEEETYKEDYEPNIYI